MLCIYLPGCETQGLPEQGQSPTVLLFSVREDSLGKKAVGFTEARALGWFEQEEGLLIISQHAEQETPALQCPCRKVASLKSCCAHAG